MVASEGRFQLTRDGLQPASQEELARVKQGLSLEAFAQDFSAVPAESISFK